MLKKSAEAFLYLPTITYLFMVLSKCLHTHKFYAITSILGVWMMFHVCLVLAPGVVR